MRKLANEKLPAIISVLLIVIMVFFMIAAGRDAGEQDIYREDVVKRGDLTVGITESGQVDMEIIQQVFELDMSDWQWEEQEESVELTVIEVCVSEGQTVQTGDTLYLLEEKTVTKLREELQYKLEKAEADLKIVNAKQELDKQNAQYTYESSIAYGGYADMEYDTTIHTLEDAVTDATENLASAREILDTYQDQLKVVKSDYTTASRVLKNCESSRDKTDRSKKMSLYIEYFELAQEAQSNLDALEEKKSELEQKVEQAKQNVESYTKQLEIAKRNLESGRLDAQETLELRQLAYNTAQENYDFTMDYLEQSARSQEEAYADAKEKWELFNTHIVGNALTANENGIISQVSCAVGDLIQTKDELVSMYDLSEVHMTVPIVRDDMEDIMVGCPAQVSFTAYPDTTFRAEVSNVTNAEISKEAAMVSGGDAQETCDVTITLKGDLSGVFQGMTGDITFIGREERDVVYISNRAVTREGTKSYVTIKDAEGNMLQQEVTTGFSDGVNVEIVDGLTEGDVICYTIREQNTGQNATDVGKIRLSGEQQIVYGKLSDVKGNEITYLVAEEQLIPEAWEHVSDGDVTDVEMVIEEKTEVALENSEIETFIYKDVVYEVTEERVTTLIPVGTMNDFSGLTEGDKIALVMEKAETEQEESSEVVETDSTTEPEMVITSVYLLD